MSDYSAPSHIRFPPGLVVRAVPDADPLTESDDRKLKRALGQLSVGLEPLFGQSQFHPRRRVVGSADWTMPESPELLSPYYRVRTSDGMSDIDLFERRDDVASALLDVGDVEAVFGVPATDLPVLHPSALGRRVDTAPAAPTPTNDFRNRQRYLGAAGVNALAARDIPGAAGSGVTVADIEGEWLWGHEDLVQNSGGMIAGRPRGDVRSRNHGTAVLGIMGADSNRFGTTGICPDALLRAVSVYGLAGGAAAAVRMAADALAPGDIVLIELHRPGPLFDFEERGDSQKGYVAVEFFPDMFDAIRYATAQGVIVVEAAGNGSQHLADKTHNKRPKGFPDEWRNPFNLADGPDSGAILVGAGAPPDSGPDQPAGSRLSFSNWADRVDAQAWGDAVVTTGGFYDGEGDLAGGDDETRWYTESFNGTSSASPMVAGALACVQGALRAAGHRPLTPYEARRALREIGPRQTDADDRPATQHIGRRPDVRAMIDWALEETPPTDDRKRRQPMRVQIIIDDGDGGGDTISVDSTKQSKDQSTTYVLENGDGPYWRGPFYLTTPEEAVKAGVPRAAQVFEASHRR